MLSNMALSTWNFLLTGVHEQLIQCSTACPAHRVLGAGRPRDMSCVLIRDLQRVPDVAQPLSERHYWDGDGQQ